jgi:hypothetical protein
MRVQALVRDRAAVFARERGLVAPNVEQPDFDADSEIGLQHGADNHAVGVDLAPAIEGDIGKRGAGNGRDDVARE